VNALTTAQLNMMSYADCTDLGMMMSTCMTGESAAGVVCGTAMEMGGGTMGGCPYSQVISAAGTTAQAIKVGTAPSLSVGGTATVSASASSGLAVTYSSATPSTCYVYRDTGLVGAASTAASGNTCTIAADQYGNSQYAPATRVTQSITLQ